MRIGATIGQQVQDGDDDGMQDHISSARRRFRPLNAAWHAMLDLVLPPLCLSCQVPLADHDALCPVCWRDITFIRPPLCDALGLPLPYDTGAPMLSAAAIADPPDYDRARAVAQFDGPLRKLVHELKFHDNQNARRLFGRWLTEAGADLLTGAQIIVPVPLAPLRLLSRRFNQSQILAAELSRLSGIAVAPGVLIRARHTRSQVGLSRLERRRNVAGAFRVTHRGRSLISGKAVLLVDDVITTGATVSAAAKVLKAAGARRVDVLSLGLVCDLSA